MNRSQAVTDTLDKPADSTVTVSLRFRLGPIFRGRLAVEALALALGLFMSAANSNAQVSNFWTGASGDWTNGLNWSTNSAPGPFDVAIFTNAATYTVTIRTNVGTFIQVATNAFANASNTTATVTLNLASGTEFDPFVRFVVADERDSTTTVYVASHATPALVAGTVAIGAPGIGTLIVTNGEFRANSVSVGAGADGRGTVVVGGSVSGSATLVYGTGGGGFAIGANSNSFGNSVIVTNGAVLTNVHTPPTGANGTFRFGSGAGQCNTSNNTMIVNSGGKLSLGTGTITIGNGSTFTFPGEGSFDNTVIIGNNGTMDCGGNVSTHSLFIGTSKGTPASNNVLSVLAGGTVVNFSQLLITSNNAVELLGGKFGGATVSGGVVLASLELGGTVTNQGTFRGYGTVYAALNVASNGVLATSNTVGSLVFSNSLNLLTNHVMQVELGSSPAATFPTVLAGDLNVRPNGTLIVSGPGASTSGTYLLFTNLCTTCSNQVEFTPWSTIIGPVPCITYTVGVGTNVSGGGINAIFLTVGPTPPQITSIVRSGNDVRLTWTACDGKTNFVQVTPGTANGSYTNNFVNLSGQIVITPSGTTTNFTDSGGATNKPARYYRVRQP